MINYSFCVETKGKTIHTGDLEYALECFNKMVSQDYTTLSIEITGGVYEPDIIHDVLLKGGMPKREEK